MRPKTGFARNGDVRIAYQVVGEGPIDLVMTPGFVSHVDLWWMNPETTRFMERLASFARVVLYDKRGTGLSDPTPVGLPSVEDRMEDLHAVLDDVGSDRTALLGFSEGGALSLLFAATYPERTLSLALFGSFAKWPTGDYLSALLPRAELAYEQLRDVCEHWGEGRLIDLLAPDYAGNPGMRQTLALYERLSASPARAEAAIEANRMIDVTGALPVIGAPTLVVHRSDELVPVELARDIAAHVPGARLLELPGNSHLPWLGDSAPVLDAFEEFFTGSNAHLVPERALVTVLFTDIVGSTDLAARLGDSGWRTLLERHDAFVAQEVRRAGGSVVKSLGDGTFARFDSPARAVRASRRIVAEAPEELGIQIRAGVHTGECEILGEDLGGMAVHVGARICARALGGEVLVSGVVRDLVLGSALEFEDRGRHELKGVPGDWHLLAVTGEASTPAPAPLPASTLAPNAPMATPVDLAAARVARVASRRPAIGARIGTVSRWGLRVRRAT